MPDPVAQVFEPFPTPIRARLLEIRGLIFEVAATDTGPLTETLKWGEPAYLPQAARTGTTIRLGWKAARPEVCVLYVPCQTNLVEGYRQDFPQAFQYEGNRAVLVPAAGPYPRAALAQIIARALTYHRKKRSI